MNNSFFLEQAARFADRLKKEAGGDAGAQVERAWRLALGRSPDDDERSQAMRFVTNEKDGLAALAQALFNLNKFVYRP
jgi:hypothetical protein